MNVKKVYRAMTLLVVILAASITLNAQATKATDKKTSDTKVNQTASVLTLSPDKVTMEVGRPLTITIKEGIKEGEKIAINWKSSNERVAIVDKEGNVTAINEGKTTITATAGDKKGICEVTVEKSAAYGLTLDPAKVTLKAGETQRITVKGTDAETILWTSTDEKVAAVEKDGTVKAVSVGKATITASAGKKEGKCEVIVEK